MNKKTVIVLSVISIILLFLFFVAASYAYYLSKIKGNSSANSIDIVIGGAKVTYTDYSIETVNEEIEPGYEHIKIFGVRNSGKTRAKYSIYLKEVENDFIRTEDIQYILYRTSGENVPEDLNDWEIVSSGIYPKTDAILLADEILENPDDFYNYAFKVIYNNDATEDQTIDMGHIFSGKIQIYGSSFELNKFSEGTLAYNILNNALLNNENTLYKSSPISIPGKETNKEDERILTTTKDNFNISYYYRGNVTNNYLELNDTCFRIVRIQGDGTIKLVLASEGVCSLSNEESGVITNTTITFNDETNNYLKSNIYEILSDWYNEKGFNSVITYWCSNNMTISSPSLECSNLFSAKVGLLSADEIAYAGGSLVEGTQTKNYLDQNVSSAYWTLSLDDKNVYSYSNSLITSSLTTDIFYLRPAIVLDRNILLLSGTGTKEDPYRV